MCVVLQFHAKPIAEQILGTAHGGESRLAIGGKYSGQRPILQKMYARMLGEDKQADEEKACQEAKVGEKLNQGKGTTIAPASIFATPKRFNCSDKTCKGEGLRDSRRAG